MNEEVLSALLPALGFAVFVRGADNSFTPITPPPSWFTRLGNVTFPFLGHILEEANQFWDGGARRTAGVGPVRGGGSQRQGVPLQSHRPDRRRADSACCFISTPNRIASAKCCPRSERESLATEQSRNATSMSAMEVRLIREEIHRILGKLLGTNATEVQIELLRKLSSRCDELALGTERLIR